MALNTPNCHRLCTSTTQVTIMNKLQQIPAAFPRLYDVSDSIKVVEVAKKYEGPEVSTACGYSLVTLDQN